MNRTEQDQHAERIMLMGSMAEARGELLEAWRVVDWWLRTSDRALRLGGGEINWTRLAIDAHQVREAIVSGLRRLSSLEYLERRAEPKPSVRETFASAQAPETEDGEEDFEQIWDELPAVKRWTQRVQRLLNDDSKSEVLMGVTRGDVPLILVALENAQEFLAYLHDWVKRTEQEVRSSHPHSHE